MNNPFYITTPIYYVNDEPHLGHAYTTILADVLARFARLRGDDTFFLTGTDEHGQKVQESARRRGLDPLAHADNMQERFRSTWQELQVTYDDFIRTTQSRHVRVVQQVLKDLWERGEIYLGGYKGWYCVADERFWTQKDLANQCCPECGRPVEKVVEANYFFRMSTYQDWLVKTIQSNPDFIQPAFRRNEVLGFLRQPLGDLCISRPINRLNWGIPLPFDNQFVTYVWFDALLNYVTAAGYGQDPQRFNELWPNAVHLIGKDILTTHCVYWPIMLKAAGLTLPKTIFAHGWWTAVDGQKMGKSLDNTVRPLDLAHIYGVDAFRYFLVREMTPGLDAEFSEKRLAECYRNDLANNLGNLLNRVVSMTQRYCGGVIPAPTGLTDEDAALRRQAEALPAQVFERIESFAVNQALISLTDSLTAANQYLERTTPWKLASAGDSARLGTVLYYAAEALRLASVLLWPVAPSKTVEIWRQLGWQPTAPLHRGLVWGGLQPGTKMAVPQPLFPYIETQTA
jgi:methionyl-tRNA synthetase